MVLPYETQRLVLITIQESICYQRYGDYFTVREEWLRSTPTPLSKMPPQYRVSIVYKHVPDSEDVTPPVLCDKIGQAVHAAPPCCVVVDLKDIQYGRLFSTPSQTKN
jgi:hypothetical protein